MFLIIFLISSSGYSQDTIIIAVPVDSTGQSLVKKEKTNSKWEYSVNFTGKKVSGYTEYHIQFPSEIYVTYDGGYTYFPYSVTGHSILAFPIDGYRLEGTFKARMNLSKKKALVFDIGLSTTISQPQKAMVDSDYIDLKDFGWSNWVQSATRSKVDYSNYDVSLNAGYPIPLGQKAYFIPKIGFQTSMNKFVVMGLAGWDSWYTPNDPDPIDSAYWAGERMGTYKVTYNRITTGAQIKTNGEEGVILFLQALYFPWVEASDHDDHLLRLKESSTDAKGKGYSIEGSMKVPVYTARNGSVWLAGLGYGMLRITATGFQIQRYYADSPDFSYDETGIQSDPIDNTELVLSFWHLSDEPSEVDHSIGEIAKA